jgi:hypothetical protein
MPWRLTAAATAGAALAAVNALAGTGPARAAATPAPDLAFTPDTYDYGEVTGTSVTVRHLSWTSAPGVAVVEAGLNGSNPQVIASGYFNPVARDDPACTAAFLPE